MKLYRVIASTSVVIGCVVAGYLASGATQADVAEDVGVRPYEMVNAGRDVNPHLPLIDFENLDGWQIETTESNATFERSREQQLWGDYVGKLTYRMAASDAERRPVVTIKPPKPTPIPTPFDCVNVWIYGNNWDWESDQTTPKVSVVVHLLDSSVNNHSVVVDTVRWKEWYLVHKKFTPETLKNLGEKPSFAGIEIQNGTNQEERVLYFDDISFYQASQTALKFEPRPARGVALPHAQTTGTNSGPRRLPFPNREETILPSNATQNYKNELLKSSDGSFVFRYQGDDTIFEWKYTPRTGTLDDIQLCSDGKSYTIKNSGLRFAGVTPEIAKLLSISNDANSVTARWNIGDNEVVYSFQIKQKSLIVDVSCLGGRVEEVVLGEFVGLEHPALVTVPFLVGSGAQRPGVAYSTTPGTLFFMPLIDHSRSNASELFFVNSVSFGENSVTANGGSRYHPKTDGKRNDCFERIFLNASSTFEEVLPTIPNDPSPWKHVTGKRVWRAHGASNHDHDFDYWRRVHRYGMKNILITDHETLWRDGGESFTFRTYAAPAKGGDEGQKEYTRKIHELGFVYGPYNNYTDYAPVNAYWNEDWVTRLSDGNWQSAWARCYNPKPAIAVQTEPKITEIVQNKFGFNTAYCDVHTAVQPWAYVDYDARVPEAGTFSATFYAYGEIMLHQKKIWGGPVYSEGNNHWYYSGLTDGNYAQDQTALLPESPWLVDFDLRKIHPLECNFGMGNPGMFFGDAAYAHFPDKNQAHDRFLAATLAFGHTGFLVMETGIPSGTRSYFAVQQVGERYATADATKIRYAGESGSFSSTSDAIASGVYKLNRISVEYDSGITVYVNGHPTTDWFCDEVGVTLPPNGWHVHDTSGTLTAWSRDVDGCRTDYVDSPAYIFAEVRNSPKGKPARFPRLVCDSQLIVLKNADANGDWEMIVGDVDYALRSTIHAVRLDGDSDADVVAFDYERNRIGTAKTIYSRGMVHIEPVDGAFSYLLTPKKVTHAILDSRRTDVVAGEKVEQIQIPHDTKSETLYWHENQLDFSIVPLCNTKASFDAIKSTLCVDIRSNLGTQASYRLALHAGSETASSRDVILFPGKTERVTFDLPKIEKQGVVPLKLEATAGELRWEKSYELKSELGFPELASIPHDFEVGYCLRGGKPVPINNKSGAYAHVESGVLCGDVSRKAWAIHPPYQNGVGYTFMLSKPFTLPKDCPVEFVSEVGIRKGGDQTDGVRYQVYVIEPSGKETLVGDILWGKKTWQELRCDLTQWQGQTLQLRLVADVGPNDNSTADWACWSNLRLVTSQPSIFTTLRWITGCH